MGPSFPSKRQAGFTLIELIVTMTLMAILAALAAPSYRELTANTRLRDTAGTLSLSLTQARSEAAKRSAPVRIVPNEGGWGQGWSILDANDTVLFSQGALEGVTFVEAPGDPVVYVASGRVLGNDPIEFSLKSTHVSEAARCVTTDAAGYPFTRKQPC